MAHREKHFSEFYVCEKNRSKEPAAGDVQNNLQVFQWAPAGVKASDLLTDGWQRLHHGDPNVNLSGNNMQEWVKSSQWGEQNEK